MACKWPLTYSLKILAEHKRPEGQNLWGLQKSALAFELKAPEVVGHDGGSTRLSFQSFSG